MEISDLIAPRDLSRARQLGLVAREVVEGLATGRHRSPHKGFSVEFRQHRSYVPGDELKTIDWKAFAKSDRLYIREFDEETNLRCHLVVDRSGSMTYGGDRSVGVGGGSITKYQYAQAIAASLAHLLIAAQDQVGAVTFDSKIRDVVPCRSRPGHMQPLLAALSRVGKHGETELANVLGKVAAKVGRRCLVVVCSDAGGDLASLKRSLAMLRSRKNEIVWFHIRDPDEIDFPFSGRIQFQDLESSLDDQIVDAKQIREQYLERRRQFDDDLRTLCRRQKVQLVDARTDVSVGELLAQFLASRRRHAAVGASR